MFVHLYNDEGGPPGGLGTIDADVLLNAISRFVSRRGMPERMRSGNGTNMVATSKEISETVRKKGRNERMMKSLQ